MSSATDIEPSAAPPKLWSRRRERFVDGDRILYGTVIAIALTVIPYYALSDRVDAAQSWRFAFLAMLLVSAAVSYGLARAGRNRLAAGLLAASVWTAVTAFGFGTGFGLHSASVFVYVPAILCAALLLGIGPAAWQTAFTIAALIAMYWAEESGRIGGVQAVLLGTTNFNFLLGAIAVCVTTLVIAVLYQRAVDRAAARTLSEMASQQRTLDELHHTQQALKVAHADLVRLNASLEQRVADRTRALEGTVRDLESFSYSISHDLRAPLRAINGFAAILQREHAAGLAHDAQRLLGRIGAASDRMDALVNALLELVQLGRHAPEKQHVDLSALAIEIAARLDRTPCGSPIDFRIASNVHATGDRRLLRIVLENLLGNAAKYARAAAAPAVEFSMEVVDGTLAYFVRDNGAGFDPRHAAGLFKPFHRLHSEAEFEGIGIGLAAVRLIIERHGGRVWAEGQAGAGAKFSFTLGAQ